MVSVTFAGLPNHETMKVNPNEPVLQNYQVEFPVDPQTKNEETCLTGGPIGWTVHGVALYNALNALGTNAVMGDDAEIFDECQGHADNRGAYHYHQIPDNCPFKYFEPNDPYGIARDGFLIYGPLKEDGSMVTEYELDKCHGRCGDDGKYRYHMTKTYPYILGCFRGTPVDYTSDRNDGNGMEGTRPPPPEGGGMGPPPGGMMPGDGMPPGGMTGGPNQCTFNDVGMEFQVCSASTGGGTGAAGHIEATFILVSLVGALAYACFNY